MHFAGDRLERGRKQQEVQTPRRQPYISLRVCNTGFSTESSRSERRDSKHKIKLNAVELEALARGGNKHMVELQQRNLNISERNTT